MDEFVQESRMAVDQEIRETPNYRVISLLKKEFEKYRLPLKYICKIDMNVNDEFFNEPEKTEEIIENLGHVIYQMHETLKEDFKEDYEYLFADWLKKIKLIYK